jgi:hypothetical protein
MSKKIFWCSVIILIASIWIWQRSENEPMSFDRATWNRNISLQGSTQDNGVVQTRMAKYLILNKQLIGKSKPQIEQILGKSIEFPDELKESRANQIVYRLSRNYIGLMGAFEQQDLVIGLDNSGKSVDAKIDIWKNGRH